MCSRCDERNALPPLPDHISVTFVGITAGLGMRIPKYAARCDNCGWRLTRPTVVTDAEQQARAHGAACSTKDRS